VLQFGQEIEHVASPLPALLYGQRDITGFIQAEFAEAAQGTTAGN
jgi:hypothetical protein